MFYRNPGPYLLNASSNPEMRQKECHWEGGNTLSLEPLLCFAALAATQVAFQNGFYT
jgi:hypothetical protein